MNNCCDVHLIMLKLMSLTITKYCSWNFHKENQSYVTTHTYTHTQKRRLEAVEICVPVLGNTVINTSGHWSVDKPGAISWLLITC